MHLKKLFKTLAPVAAMGFAATLSACDGIDVSINGSNGKPLAEIDLSGEPPKSVTLAGPDTVLIEEGETFTVAVEGSEEAKERMRFEFEDGELIVMREDSSWGDNDSATVSITMPPPEALTIAGSGRISSATMASTGDLTIAGSGDLVVESAASENLEITIAGSGDAKAAGATERLEITIAGSGKGDLSQLTAERADISIAGSGDVTFRSDGEVEASIIGSGDVTVIGRAKCTINSMGSGTLNCSAPANSDEDGEETDEAA